MLAEHTVKQDKMNKDDLEEAGAAAASEKEIGAAAASEKEIGSVEFDNYIINENIEKYSSFDDIGLKDSICKPQFSTAVGSLLVGTEKQLEISDFLPEKADKIDKKSVFGRFYRWLEHYI